MATQNLQFLLIAYWYCWCSLYIMLLLQYANK